MEKPLKSPVFADRWKKEKSSKPACLLDFFGGEEGIRTPVRLLAN